MSRKGFISKYDASRRKGFTISINSSSGRYNSQGNDAHDCGQPGAWGMASYSPRWTSAAAENRHSRYPKTAFLAFYGLFDPLNEAPNFFRPRSRLTFLPPRVIR